MLCASGHGIHACPYFKLATWIDRLGCWSDGRELFKSIDMARRPANASRFAFADSSGYFWTTLGDTSARSFMNTVMHEHGHGMGLQHVTPTNGSKLMEPTLSVAFDGPQFDDIRRAQWNYGDPYEKTGPNLRGRNDTIATANDLGVLANGNLTLSNWGDANNPTTPRSIAGTGDADFLQFTIGGTVKRSVSFTVSPFGPSYAIAPQNDANPPTPQTLNTSSLGNLTAAIHNASGTALVSANVTGYGGSEVVTIPDLHPGTYYLRIGVSQTADSISNTPTQAYNVSAFIANYTVQAPTNVRLAPEADTGSSNSDGITNIASPIITGSGNPDDSIVVYLRSSTNQLFGPISSTVGPTGTGRMEAGFPLPNNGI